MTKPLRISVLGTLGVEVDGQTVDLPASRKARALLAYLALSARPARRERLCDLFWDLPDDPRGSLRWALSKLRRVLDAGDLKRVRADRERVSLHLAEAEVDLVTIRTRLLDDGGRIPADDLAQMVDVLAEPLLPGLDVAGSDAFQTWLMAEREDARLLLVTVLRYLAIHPMLSPAERLKWAQLWLDLMPFEAEAASVLVATCRATGRLDRANEVDRQFRENAAEALIPVPPDFGAAVLLNPHGTPTAKTNPRSSLRSQHIGFCKAGKGTSIAYASVGQGRPLVKAANWLNHLELDWDSPIWGPTFMAFAQDRRFIRYDERGNGLSDWNVDDFSLEAFVRDLEAVVDAMGLERFPLLGISQGCAVSIEYAARHPERVSGLILVSGYATGWRIGASEEEQERREAVMTLTRLGWGTPNPAYRQIFSQTFMPDAAPSDLDWFNEFQRQTTSPENAVRFQEAFGDIDVRASLPKVQAPTIVFHSRGDQRIALEQGRELAIGIPNAQFVPLDSRNHILLGSEPAWDVFMDRTRDFLREHDI